MQEASFLPKNINTIQHLIATFSTLTNIDLFFYSKDKEIINNHQVLSASQSIHNYLTQIKFKAATIFPVILDNSFAGFFILNVNSDLKEQIMMYRSYLESTTDQLEETIKHRLVVLNALTPNQLRAYFADLSLISGRNDEHRKDDDHDQKGIHLIKNDKNAEGDNVDKNFIKALDYINSNITKPLTLEDVAQRVYFSPSYLSRLFKNYFDVNFIDYINIRKVALAQEQIALTNTPINKLSHQLGFSQASYFTKIFKQKCGITPSKFRLSNPKIKKIYTIPRDLTWRKNQSAYTISKNYFREHGISFEASNLNGYLYVYSIGGLASDAANGWTYTVNCMQPTTPPTGMTVGDKSVIQWVYTGLKSF